MGAGASAQKQQGAQQNTETARNEAAEQVKQILSGYDSDVDNELGYQYAGRRELTDVADGSGQGMNVKPWAAAIFAPTNWSDKKLEEQQPTDSLVLEYVYGYRGYDSRDNLCYTASGEVVYISAALGIALDTSTNKQRFYLGHNDDVMCMSMHKDGSIIATGQVGHDPKVCLWDVNSMSTIGVIHGVHERGVSAVSLSSDLKRVASVGMDDQNTLVVHEIQGEKITKLGAVKNGDSRVFLCKFNPTIPNQIVSVGQRHMRIHTLNPGAAEPITTQSGLFGNKGPQNVLSLAFLQDGTIVTGTEGGEIYKWKGNQIQSAVQAHQGPVFTLYVDGQTILSGGKDGKVLEFHSTDLKLLKTYDLRDSSQNLQDSTGRPLLFTIGKSSSIRSVFRKNGKILVGTIACEVMEFDEESASTKLLVQGHSGGEVWGLATHPTGDFFATTADDKTLRLWDTKKRKMIAMRKISASGRSVAYSADGSLIAVGMINGGLVVVDSKSESLKEVFSNKIRKEEIGELKFSPCGKFLAVGSHDNLIDIYDVTRNFKNIGVLKGHNSFIIHLDWSADSRYIQSNCGAYELLFWDVRTQEQIKAAHELRDVEWASWTCILGWPVQGIWQKLAKGTDINAVDRSHMEDCLATGDDFGTVNIFQYPIPKTGSTYKRYPAHSSHVTNVRWMGNDRRLISTGGDDQTVMQWKHLDESEGMFDDDDDVNTESSYSYEKNRTMKEKSKPILPPSIFEEEMQHSRPPLTHPHTSESSSSSSPAPSKQQFQSHLPNPDIKHETASKPSIPSGWFSATPPWLGAIFPPTNATPSDGEVPDDQYVLDFVFGYRGHDARDNLYYLSNGEIVYSAAGVGIVYRPDNNSQRFFMDHTDDIVSLTLHPDGNIVATGQVGKDPLIIVWEASTLKKLAVLHGAHQRAVTSLGFSPDGTKLVSVGMDDKHTIVVWDWKNQRVIASADGHTDKIFSIDFNPFDETMIVSAGVRHIKFWTLNGHSLENKRGVFTPTGELQTIHSTTFLSPSVTVAGTEGGHLYRFEKNVLTEVVKNVHNGAVLALSSSKNGIVSGGIDGKVKLLGNDLRPYKDIVLDLAPFTTRNLAFGNSIRSVRWNASKVVVATESSEVYEGDITTKALKLLTTGHSGGETWGLAVHPTQPRFATSSEDGTVRVWSIVDRRQTALKKMGAKGTSAAYSQDGSTLAVGTNDGKIFILDAETFNEKAHVSDRTERISDIKFSPNGKLVAVGSHDNFIDIYSIDGFKRVGVLKGHSSYITHLDWSKDSQHIQSTCGAYELLFWDVDSFTQNKFPHKLRDIAWETQTCVLGWSVQGIWPRGSNGTDINAVTRSHSGTLLASADDFGTLKIFKYPTVLPKSKSNSLTGHSAHVTNVAFSLDDKFIVTSGGGDRTVMIWKKTIN